MPINQTLITPDLAIAFDIGNTHNPYNTHYHHQQPPAISMPSSQPNSGKFDSSELAGDEPVRTLKRPPVRGSYADDQRPPQEKKALPLFPVGDD
ncbi:hypothetical protein Hanom_Chr08g00750251 [Helianthus anomalus]